VGSKNREPGAKPFITFWMTTNRHPARFESQFTSVHLFIMYIINVHIKYMYIHDLLSTKTYIKLFYLSLSSSSSNSLCFNFVDSTFTYEARFDVVGGTDRFNGSMAPQARYALSVRELLWAMVIPESKVNLWEKSV
jgi:hypothetical protein